VKDTEVVNRDGKQHDSDSSKENDASKSSEPNTPNSRKKCEYSSLATGCIVFAFLSPIVPVEVYC